MVAVAVFLLLLGGWLGGALLAGVCLAAAVALAGLVRTPVAGAHGPPNLGDVVYAALLAGLLGEREAGVQGRGQSCAWKSEAEGG